MNPTDRIYKKLIAQVLNRGTLIETRNHSAYSLIDSDTIQFSSTPLVTVRKTAWKKALREMEWFLSGDSACPDELLDWWDGQLDGNNKYNFGYGWQLRHWGNGFDQIQSLIEGIKEHPYSRRHVITTWNPYDMSIITKLNNNPKTPSTCHLTIGQYFVRNGQLYARTYQRSCDAMLGLVHNILQHWGLLLWLASQTNLGAGSLIWNWGDLHIYNEASHLEVAKSILDESDASIELRSNPTLVYRGSGDFKADDFSLIGDVSSPATTVRPKLL